MTKVVFLTHSAAASGAELALVRALDEWPMDSEVLVILAEAGDIEDRCRELDIPVTVVPIEEPVVRARRGSSSVARLRSLVHLLVYARRLREILRKEEADVVVGRSLRAAVYGRIATAGLGKPFVWSVHDRLSSDYLGRSYWFFSRVLPGLMNGFVVNSASTLETVRTGRKPVLVMPPSLVVDDRRRPPRPPGRTRVVVLGRLSEWKGQDQAIEAFARVAAEGEADLHIVGSAMFGESDYESSLQQAIASSGMSGRIHLRGHHSDPRAVLLEADILLHCSRIPEPFGAVVIEGMLAGCVVIATSPGGPAEVIEHGSTGFLARAGDVDDLTANLRRAMMMTEDERLRMTTAAGIEARKYDARKLSPRLAGWLAGVASARESGTTRGVL